MMVANLLHALIATSTLFGPANDISEMRALITDTISSPGARAQPTLLTNLRVIIEPPVSVAPPVVPPKRPEVKPREAGATIPPVASPPKQNGATQAKCYDTLLQFSLGDADATERAKAKNNSCN
jgi:hypothetical protein